MAEKKYQCNVHTTGICGVHNINVERRNNLQKEVDEMKPIKKIVYGLVASSSLILIVVTSCFSYSNETREKMEIRDKVTNDKINKLSIQVERLATISEMRGKQSDNVIRVLKDLNINMEKVIKRNND